MPLDIYQFPCLQDNYGFLVHDASTKTTATIDTPDAKAINKALATKNWKLTHILNTHHHFDHVGGNLALQEEHNCLIVGPKADAQRIPGIEIQVEEGDNFKLGETSLEIYDVPGHTKGHIAYLARDERVGFVGDTLFSLGCGRLFEGTPQQMWNSLKKIMTWPSDCKLYCAHEYTEANANFALTIEPQNKNLQERVKQIRELRAQGQPTVPTTLQLEKDTNPFLRPDSFKIKTTLDMPTAEAVHVFAEIRRRKDNF